MLAPRSPCADDPASGRRYCGVDGRERARITAGLRSRIRAACVDHLRLRPDGLPDAAERGDRAPTACRSNCRAATSARRHSARSTASVPMSFAERQHPGVLQQDDGFLCHAAGQAIVLGRLVHAVRNLRVRTRSGGSNMPSRMPARIRRFSATSMSPSAISPCATARAERLHVLPHSRSQPFFTPMRRRRFRACRRSCGCGRCRRWRRSRRRRSREAPVACAGCRRAIARLPDADSPLTRL